MIQEIIFLRAKQIYRALASIGWLVVLIIPFLVIILLGLFEGAEKGSYHLSMLIGLMLGTIHFLRNDLSFLSQITLQPAWIRMAEYVLIALIFAGLQLLLTGEYMNALFFIPFAALLAWLPVPKFSSRRQWWLFPVAWLPAYFFEWRAGLRTAGWFWSLLFILAIATAQFWEPIIIVYILLFGISVSSWYDYLEPKEILDVDAEQGNFLLRKISKHLGLLLMFQFVPFVVGIFCWPNLWLLILIATSMTLFMLTFAILYKYANYTNDRVRLYSQLPTGIFNGAIIIPLTTFLCLVYLAVYWKKAIRNIKKRYA